MPIDVEANRAAVKYGTAQMTRRIAWMFGALLFRLTPRPAFGFRNALLRLFGASIGRQVHIYPSVRIFLPENLSVGDWSAIGERAEIYNLGRIEIGQQTTVSQRAHLCAGTHDYQSPGFELLKPPIKIGDGVWVCADAFIGPGVVVNDHAIVAARAVVIKDVAAATIVAGNPARLVKQRQTGSSDA